MNKYNDDGNKRNKYLLLANSILGLIAIICIAFSVFVIVCSSLNGGIPTVGNTAAIQVTQSGATNYTFKETQFINNDKVTVEKKNSIVKGDVIAYQIFYVDNDKFNVSNENKIYIGKVKIVERNSAERKVYYYLQTDSGANFDVVVDKVDVIGVCKKHSSGLANLILSIASPMILGLLISLPLIFIIVANFLILFLIKNKGDLQSSYSVEKRRNYSVTVNNNALRRNTQNSNSMGVVRANRSLMVPDQKMANKYYAPSKPVNNAKFQKEYAGKNNEYDKHSASSVVDAEIVYDGNIGSNPQSQLYDNSYEQSSNKLSNQITTRNSYDLERIRNNRAIAQAILNEKDAEEEKRVREYVRSTFQNALRDEKSEFMKKARINMEMAKTEQEIKNKLLNAKFGSQGFAKNSKRDAKYKKFVEDLINKEKKLKEQALKSQRGNNVKHNIDHNGPIIKNAVRSNNEIITQHNANSGIYNNSKMSNNGILFGGNFGLVDKNVSNNISQKTAFSAKEIKSGKQKIQIQNQTKPKNNLSKLPTENNKVMKTMAGGIFFNNDFKKSALSTPNQNEVQHKKVNSQFSNDGRFIEKTVKKVKSNDKSSNASGGAYIATNNGFIINKKEKK